MNFLQFLGCYKLSSGISLSVDCDFCAKAKCSVAYQFGIILLHEMLYASFWAKFVQDINYVYLLGRNKKLEYVVMTGYIFVVILPLKLSLLI